MYIILSQKLKPASQYADVVYKEYEFPKRYINNIHENDVFIYYQGDRSGKPSDKYYYGKGRIGKITEKDNNLYVAELQDCYKFENTVSIYHRSMFYVEQLGEKSGRAKPPWQNSIRLLSEEAYDYIIENAGNLIPEYQNEKLGDFEEKLKKDLREYYVGEKKDSILRVIDDASRIAEILKLK